jgi:hypothetical protein
VTLDPRPSNAELLRRKAEREGRAIATAPVHDPYEGMNGTEKRRAVELEAMRRAGELAWWCYEGLKLRLAANTFYTPDFFLQRSDGTLEVEETKGHWEDDARVKIKVAARLYPFRFRALQPMKGGGWKVEEF